MKKVSSSSSSRAKEMWSGKLLLGEEGGNMWGGGGDARRQDRLHGGWRKVSRVSEGTRTLREAGVKDTYCTGMAWYEHRSYRSTCHNAEEGSEIDSDQGNGATKSTSKRLSKFLCSDLG